MASTSEPDLTRHFDFTIVGAGVVGSALAYSLARSGRSVVLVERDLSHPDRIVGELLQPGGVKALHWLGMGECLDGIDAVPVEGYQVFYGPRAVPIPYPEEAGRYGGKGVKSTSGRVEGRSFHHGNFVSSLRRKAMSHPNVTTLEATVRDLVTKDNKIVGVRCTRSSTSASSNSGPTASEADSSSSSSELTLNSTITIVADGCFSKFRRTHGSSISPKVRSNFVGLELSHAPLPAPHHGHVVLSPSGPILLYQIGSTHTRILIDVAGEKLPSQAKGELQRHIREDFLPHIPEELRPCIERELDAGQRLRSMPNSFLPPSMQGQSKDREGVIVVGDALNMRHPLTGGGMSVGLWDCVHLTKVLGGSERWWSDEEQGDKHAKATTPLDLADWPNCIRPALRTWHWRRKSLASVINILAQALYSLFGADDASLSVLREGCFKYFELGGECVGGPVSLLSGLEPNPVLLVDHFFRVALYSIYCLFAHEQFYEKEGRARKAGLLEWPGLVWRSVMVFWTACVVILPVIWTEMRANVPRFPDSAKKQGATILRPLVLLVALAGVAGAVYFNSSSSSALLSSRPPSSSFGGNVSHGSGSGSGFSPLHGAGTGANSLLEQLRALSSLFSSTSASRE
ncbi:SE-domain-containing protein [Jaminaea rosea]|uniref:Squalene epoxidase ERG1 n=1 Tax=Jaminaea rosea TaxID=1569628 RepID=A0A316URH7_9BASI|nr:SE-domain-containing protein [Jaminaea rosea]PWN27887.1 SE-domain-containing protein [Jaminaea rosea]